MSGVHRVLDRAWDFTRAGDGRNALVVLETVTEEFLAGCESLDDSYGDVGAFFRELGPAWAEALLSAELTSEERQSWARKLEAWQESVESYGIDEVFDVALEAAEQGWDFLPLQPLYRIGRLPNPLVRPPISAVSSGRFDDPLRRFRTLLKPLYNLVAG